MTTGEREPRGWADAFAGSDSGRTSGPGEGSRAFASLAGCGGASESPRSLTLRCGTLWVSTRSRTPRPARSRGHGESPPPGAGAHRPASRGDSSQTSRAACEAAAYRDVSPDSAAGRSLCVTNSLGLWERCVVLAARAPVLCAVGSAKSHLHVDRGEIHNINTSPVDKMAVPHPEFRPKCLLKTPGAHPIPTRLEQILFTSGTPRG